MKRAPGALVASLLLALGAVACTDGDDETNLPFVTVFAPSGEQSGEVTIDYSIRDQDGRFAQAFPFVEGAFTLTPATPAPGSPPTTNRRAGSFGVTSQFIWDSFADLGPGIFPLQTFRIDVVGRDGLSPPGVSPPFVLNNSDGFAVFEADAAVVTTGAIAVQLADSRVVEVLGEDGQGGALLTSRVFDPNLGDLLAGPSLQTARSQAAAARSIEGLVVAGGLVGGVASADAELLRFDDTSPGGQREATGALQQARFGHRMTALRGGRILVTGGDSGAGLVSAAELRQAAAFAVVADDARLARVGHSATLLSSGEVLILGGQDGAGAALASAVIVSVAADGTTTLRDAGGLSLARSRHAALRLEDGRVLVVGGSADGSPAGAIGLIELFDPVSGVSQSFAQSLATPRLDAALIQAGDLVTVVGGVVSGGGGASRAEQLDLVSGQLGAPRFDQRLTRGAATALALGDGNALIFGDGALPEFFIPLASAQEEGFRSLSLNNRPRRGAETFVFRTEVVLYGGEDGFGISADIEVFDVFDGSRELRGQMLTARADFSGVTIETSPAGVMTLMSGGRTPSGLTGSCEVVEATFGGSRLVGSLITPRASHEGVLLQDGSVLIVGGRDINGDALASAELFERSTEAWRSVGGLSTPRTGFAIAVLPTTGEVLVAGGVDGAGAPVNTIELYDPVTERFEVVATMASARRAPTLAFSDDDLTVAVLGGADAAGPRMDGELFDVASEQLIGLASLTIPRVGGQAVALDGGQTLILGGFRDAAGLRDARPELFVFDESDPTLAGGRAPDDATACILRRDAMAARVGGSVTIIGGQTPEGVTLAGSEIYRIGD